MITIRIASTVFHARTVLLCLRKIVGVMRLVVVSQYYLYCIDIFRYHYYDYYYYYYIMSYYMHMVFLEQELYIIVLAERAMLRYC